MLRILVLAVFAVNLVSAAIWPDRLATYKLRASMGVRWNPPSSLPSASDPRALLEEEFGQADAEAADYGEFKVTAVRYKDTTGAYAASLEPDANHMSRIGNYLVSCEGGCPKDFLKLAESGLPAVSGAPVPMLGGYLPSNAMIPHSRRYIMGPVGLQANAPQIQQSAVALQFGTEGEMARYRTPKGEETLAIFSYPTPQIARQQAPAFEGIPGAVVKRTGPLLALVVPSDRQSGADLGEARKLLGQVQYEASVAWNEPLPLVIRPQTAAQMVLAILTLAGIVLGFCLLSGLAFGAIRVVARRFGYSGADGRMTTLHLGGK
jgi:hypothetical protein